MQFSGGSMKMQATLASWKNLFDSYSKSYRTYAEQQGYQEQRIGSTRRSGQKLGEHSILKHYCSLRRNNFLTLTSKKSAAQSRGISYSHGYLKISYGRNVGKTLSKSGTRTDICTCLRRAQDGVLCLDNTARQQFAMQVERFKWWLILEFENCLFS